MASPRILIHPAAPDASSLYRLELLALHIPSATVEYDRVYQLELYDTALGTTEISRLLDPPDADVVVLQRPLRHQTYLTIRGLQQHGIKVVVELDDDFQAVQLTNAAYKESSPLLSPEKNWEWLKKSCEIADWVTVTTPAVAARYAPHGRVTVLPNYVPASYLSIERVPHAGTWVGWSGSVRTHPGDLELTQGQVSRAITDAGAYLHAIGTGEGVRDRLGHSGPMSQTGWVSLADYPEFVVDLDVGIVPLKLNRFNAGRAG